MRAIARVGRTTSPDRTGPAVIYEVDWGHMKALERCLEFISFTCGGEMDFRSLLVGASVFG